MVSISRILCGALSEFLFFKVTYLKFMSWADGNIGVIKR